MGDLPTLLAVATVMGLSLFLAMPLIVSRRAQGRWAVGLNAAAIGILIFLLGDLFSNVSPILYPKGYLSDPAYAASFLAAFLAAFLALFALDNRPGRSGESAETAPGRTALIVAIGIGLQNLTEGLVFGANWVAGSVGVVAVVFVGFFLQNVSEGFPIAAPFLGRSDRQDRRRLTPLFLIGGLPTIAGAAIGYFWSSDLFLVVFDALAIGAIAYVILPMLRVALRPEATRELSQRRHRLVYLGVLVGFAIGFAVNAI